MMIDENTYTELSNRAYEYSARNSNENYLKIIQDSYDMKKKEKKLADRIKVKPIQHNEQLPQKRQERNGVEKDENSKSTYVNRYDVETGQATELFEIDKSDVSPGTSINGLKAISEDDIKIIIGNILQTYSMKGELKSSVKIEASIENAAQICIDKVGNIFTTVFDDNSRKLCIYKFDSTGKKIAENSVNFYPTKMVLDNKDRLIIRYEEGETTVTSGIQYFDAATLEAIEKENLSFEHLPSGIDTMSVIMNKSEISGCK